MADLTKKDIFIWLEKEVLKNFKDKKNFVIVTIPGLGMSHELREIIKRNRDFDINYIHEMGSDLSLHNILDMNVDKNEDVFMNIDHYFRAASSDQKFAVVINVPHILDTNEYTKAFFSSRVYSHYFHRTMNRAETSIYATSLNSKLKSEQIDRIYSLSGGIARIVKYIVLHDDGFDINVSRLINDLEFKTVLESVTRVVGKCSDAMLTKLKVKEKGVYKSQILETYFKLNPTEEVLNLEVNDDLSFTEEGELSDASLTSSEKLILQDIVKEKTISREKIAEFKWGEGSYDEYSDQAINKTMQRLSKKLTKFTITPIPKVGYKIEKNPQND